MDEQQELKKELAALKARVQTLEDLASITQLVSKYGPSVDSGSAETASHIWTEEGVFAVLGGERTFTMNGRPEVYGMVAGPGHQSLIHSGCAHVLTAPYVELNGDEAIGRSYAMNIRWDDQADRFWVARVSANRWRLTRTPEGWRVVERINSNLDGSAESRALLTPA